MYLTRWVGLVFQVCCLIGYFHKSHNTFYEKGIIIMHTYSEQLTPLLTEIAKALDISDSYFELAKKRYDIHW